MNILVWTASPRKGSNTDQLADAFAEGAREAGHQVTVRRTYDYQVAPCLACGYCRKHDGVCVQKDDMNALLNDIAAADALVIASPIYWFDVTAQAKCFIDRIYAHGEKGFAIKKAAYLLVSASPDVYTAARAQLHDLCNYLKWENGGTFEAPGVGGRGEIAGTDYLQGARDFGRAF